MTTLPAVVNPAQAQLIDMALATCHSKATRRVYRIRLNQFLASGHTLTREGVALHLQELRDRGQSSSILVGATSAIRKLVTEAQIRGLITRDEALQILEIKSGKRYKTRVGQWLTVAQVQQLLSLPDRTTYYGRRDAAVLCILVGCALRRAEMASLTWEHYQEREGRMCLVNLLGKGSKDRTIPVPTWAVADVDAWYVLSRQPPPPPVTHADKLMAPRRKYRPSLITGGLGYEGLFDLVEMYGLRMNVNIAPHDLRRTLAQMLRRSGAPLEQIQATLGHANISTTQIYLNSTIELAPGLAAVDRLNLQPQQPPSPLSPVEKASSPLGEDGPEPGRPTVGGGAMGGGAR